LRRTGCPTELVVTTHDDLAREGDDLSVTDLADLHEGVTGSIRPPLAEPAEPIDLGRLEDRKHLLPAGFDQRAVRGPHRHVGEVASGGGSLPETSWT
jgi:hypothetical protein